MILKDLLLVAKTRSNVESDVRNGVYSVMIKKIAMDLKWPFHVNTKQRQQTTSLILDFYSFFFHDNPYNRIISFQNFLKKIDRKGIIIAGQTNNIRNLVI